MKRAKFATILFGMVLFVLSTRQASARPWIFDDVQHWAADLVCQNGAIVSGYNFNSGVLNSFGNADEFDLTLQAQLLPADFFAQSGYVMTPFQAQVYEQYGMVRPLGVDVSDYALSDLGDSILIEVVEQPNRLFTDFSRGDLVSIYGVGFLEWETVQPVGTLVAITRYDSSFLVARVADCLLPELNDVKRVSISSNGIEGNGDSAESTITAHGMRIAYRTDGDNLDPNATDDNDSADIYLHTLSTNKTQLVSIENSPSALQAGGGSSQPAISYDGDRVVFTSDAVLLSFDSCTFGDSDGQADIHQWTADLSVIERNISVYRESGGAYCNPLDEANYQPAINQTTVVFTTDTPLFPPSDSTVVDRNELTDILRLENMIDGTSTVSAYPNIHTSNGASDYADIATIGRWVTYETTATDLVVDSNGTTSDIILTDSDTLTHQLISVSSSGTQANGASNHPAIAGLANHIAFDSLATNLHPDVPAEVRQVYVRSLDEGCTTLLSQTGAGVIGNGDSEFAAISGNGRFVVFQSDATNLVPNDNNSATDIFVIDRDADEDGLFYKSTGCGDVDETTITRISLTETGAQANDDSTEPDMSANGAYVSFTSKANNIVANDNNGATDVFVTFIGYPSLEVSPPTAVTLFDQQSDASNTGQVTLIMAMVSLLLSVLYMLRRKSVVDIWG